MFAFLEKLFPRKEESQKFYLLIAESLPAGFSHGWEKGEEISEAALPDCIFALLLEGNLSLLRLNMSTDFSFRHFCKDHLNFDYEATKVQSFALATVQFHAGDQLYFLKRREGHGYIAVIYEKNSFKQRSIH